MNPVLSKLLNGLVVSCQAKPGEAPDKPEILAALARSAVDGGAVGIRANRPENITAIRAAVGPEVPIIGIFKKDYKDSPVRITPTLADALEVAEAGADIIAIDATLEHRPNGETLDSIVEGLRPKTRALLMADCATVEEGVNASRVGFDIVATTLSGYTAATAETNSGAPDLDLIANLHRCLPPQIFLIAEGRFNTPRDAVEAMRCGADAVVVGTAITRPQEITRRFAAAIRRHIGLRDSWAIGVDIGGTKTAVALVSSDGSASHLMTIASPWDKGTREVMRYVKSGILQVANKARRPVSVIGIAASGRVNVEKGVVFDGVPLADDYFNFPLADEVAQIARKPVFVENDANAAAWAESRVGAGRNARRLAVLTIGTGIGGGIVIDGELLRGSGNAGEFGHICIEAGGRKSLSGFRGALEMYVSRRLLQQEIEALYREKKLPGATIPPIDTDRIIKLIRDGEPQAVGIFRRQMDYLAAGLQSIFNMLDPDLIVIGGEFSKLGDVLIRNLKERLPRPMNLAVSPLGNQAGLIGAALLALDRSAG